MIQRLHQLSNGDLRSIAAALRSGRLSAPYAAIAFQRFLSPNDAETLAAEFQQLADKGFSAAQLALLIDVLVRDRASRHSRDERIELVTTGPESYAVMNRDTGVVVRDLFAGAEQSVLVVGYAVFQGRAVFEALADRMRDCPELFVRLFLDVRRNPGDTTTSRDLVRRFAHRFWKNEWPEDRPRPEAFYFTRSLEADARHRSSLHAKCVVVDARSVFVSSANFTEAAHNRNIEVGLAIESPLLASKLASHFDALLQDGVLAPLR